MCVYQYFNIDQNNMVYYDSVAQDVISKDLQRLLSNICRCVFDCIHNLHNAVELCRDVFIL